MLYMTLGDVGKNCEDHNVCGFFLSVFSLVLS